MFRNNYNREYLFPLFSKYYNEHLLKPPGYKYLSVIFLKSDPIQFNNILYCVCDLFRICNLAIPPVLKEGESSIVLKRFLFTDLPPDICDNYADLPLLSDLTERTSGYTLPEGQMLICDDSLTAQWYRMDDYVLTSSTAGCGTFEVWYTEGLFLNVFYVYFTPFWGT